MHAGCRGNAVQRDWRAGRDHEAAGGGEDQRVRVFDVRHRLPDGAGERLGSGEGGMGDGGIRLHTAHVSAPSLLDPLLNAIGKGDKRMHYAHRALHTRA